MNHEWQIVSFEDGIGPTVQIGYVNSNGQRCLGTLRIRGTDKNAFAYKMECSRCGYVYGVNSGDVHERKCPNCQGGSPGIRYWLRPDEVSAACPPTEICKTENGLALVGIEPTADWIQRMSGSFRDDPVFAEMVRLGREFREADRPADDEP